MTNKTNWKDALAGKGAGDAKVFMINKTRGFLTQVFEFGIIVYTVYHNPSDMDKVDGNIEIVAYGPDFMASLHDLVTKELQRLIDEDKIKKAPAPDKINLMINAMAEYIEGVLAA